MSQRFNLQLATDSLSADAQQLGIPYEQLQQIRIRVNVSIVQQPQPQLWLCYDIQLPSSILAEQLDWPTWKQAQVGFTDYLWERTCLECFISGNAIIDNENQNENQNRYIEINASPRGQYALYQFDDYRTPSMLPPLRLLKADGVTPARIHWLLSNAWGEQATTLSPLAKPINNTTNLAAGSFTPRYYYQRRFGLLLDELPVNFLHNDISTDTGIELIHPCVILRFGNTHLYFAPTHASPPDFHQRRYWSRFGYQTALAK